MQIQDTPEGLQVSMYVLLVCAVFFAASVIITRVWNPCPAGAVREREVQQNLNAWIRISESADSMAPCRSTRIRLGWTVSIFRIPFCMARKATEGSVNPPARWSRSANVAFLTGSEPRSHRRQSEAPMPESAAGESEGAGSRDVGL